MSNKNNVLFSDLGLSTPILKALNDLGYKKPSPIQKQCIPLLMNGKDVLGIAQTGSGKTAAFGLPLLNNINPCLKTPQVLILAPTRELAIQIAEAINSFSKHINNINIIALYGGQRYDIQLRALKQGPQIVVGTPGRLLDHLKRKTLKFSNIKYVVLDEADEMLRMGFIEDVENTLNQIPTEHQTALFSATMPNQIRRIIHRFMKEPEEIYIKSNIITRPDITQNYCNIYNIKKNEALVRFLEVEDFDAAIIFVRTKNATLEVSEILERNGYNSAALNGDMNQTLREQTLKRLRNGNLDILIATDIAARGLDVDRITLVINYDIPMDVESYVHRIGRTGRAGKSGRALLFIENRERRLLRNVERAIKLTIPEVKLPGSELLSKRRQEKFAKKIQQQLESNDLDKYRRLLTKVSPLENIDFETLAAVLLKMAQGNRCLILQPDSFNNSKHKFNIRNTYRYNHNHINLKQKNNNHEQYKTKEMETYRIEVGRNDGVEIRHIVGAIANEADINNHYIGNIKLFNTYSIIELPKNMPKKILTHLNKIYILNKPIQIQLIKNTKQNKRNEQHYNQYSNENNKNNNKTITNNRNILKNKNNFSSRNRYEKRS